MIYFLQSSKGGPIKIGYTDRGAEERRRACEAGCPLPLRLIGEMPGTRIQEKELHEHFDKYRFHGEWFYASAHLRAFICSNCPDVRLRDIIPSPIEEFDYGQSEPEWIQGGEVIRRFTMFGDQLERITKEGLVRKKRLEGNLPHGRFVYNVSDIRKYINALP